MLPSVNGWSSGPGSSSFIFSGSAEDYFAPFEKKKQIAILLSSTPSEASFDKAYEIAETIEIYYDRIYAISDVTCAYARLNTVAGLDSKP